MGERFSSANVIFFDKKPASETPWTKKLWIYDLRTNKDFTLKTNPLKREDLDEFVKCYFGLNDEGENPPSVRPLSKGGSFGRQHRKATWSEKNPEGRWRSFDYDELINRDKASLDIFWLKDFAVRGNEVWLDYDSRYHPCRLENNLLIFDLGEELGNVKNKVISIEENRLVLEHLGSRKRTTYIRAEK